MATGAPQGQASQKPTNPTKPADTNKATDNTAQLGAGAVNSATKVSASDKPAREAVNVTMKDGRTVEFVGKRKMLKSSKIDGDKVTVTLDFRNGESITFTPPPSLMARFAAHGIEQKLGDETAGTEKVDDMVLEVQALADRLAKGEWGTVREPGGFAGASIVIRAIMEAKKLVGAEGKAKVQAWLDGKLEAAKAKGETLSRKSLYDAFRKPGSQTGVIIERIEREERAGKSTLDADKELADLTV